MTIKVLEEYDPATNSWPIIKKFQTWEEESLWWDTEAKPDGMYHSYDQEDSLRYRRFCP